MDREHEIENLRRSLAMLTHGVCALTREQALELVELANVQRRLTRLRAELRRLVDEDG